jgi:hypothetical protein
MRHVTVKSLVTAPRDSAASPHFAFAKCVPMSRGNFQSLIKPLGDSGLQLFPQKSPN